MFQIEKGQDIKQELLHRYKTILPDELIKIWEDNGLARLMGGYLKVVNPEDYQELLKETYFRGNISVPILVTAFGDIVTFEEGFREGNGHIIDTPDNRSKILNVANDKKNYLGRDARGNDWYAKTESDGSQIWVRTRNGKVDNAGINTPPRIWDDETGLYNNKRRK